MNFTTSLYRNVVAALLIAACAHVTYANNIQVTNISLLEQETDSNWTQIQFDLSWENSWRLSSGPANYDGAWVFVKYRTTGSSWQHATINYVDGTGTGDGHVVPPNAVVKTASDGTGAFIYRSADGSGDIMFSGVQLRWDYGADFVADGAVVDVRIFAIEMVYIPTGTFPLGSTSTGSEISNFYTETGIFGFKGTYPVTSEAAIPVSPAIGDLYYDFSLNAGDQLGPIPAEYPKGYQAFWCMKYELTEDQYVSFFNTLTPSQKTTNDITAAKGTDAEFERNTVSWTGGNATTSAPSRAVSFMSYDNCAAYLDWAGLRFLTEMEFEKAAKGPVHTNNMLATAGIDAGTEFMTIANDGTDNAVITNLEEGITNMNYSFTSPGGPVRVGIFAASSVNHTREETGGSYYGVMEMSGNLFERNMSAGTPLNRAYTGAHGDGTIQPNGLHNVANWPGTGTEGASGYRGGSWDGGIFTCRIADRQSSA
ncbi:MAG: SUMF1/EgtB/PvdO family nonheme iron enzyme, partial [Saprospiraceae bacterium]|nr:SUMF1/EgtB/PvdO family nonheme iron enzyme [Saprospiraceae bacterium]